MGVLTAVSSLSLMTSCVKNVTQSREDIAQVSSVTQSGEDIAQTPQEPVAASYQSEPEPAEPELEPELERHALPCTYTGVILVMKDDQNRPVIKIENMCPELVDGRLKEGRHQVVQADAQGEYPIPFRNAHLILRDNKPYIVYEDEGKVVTAPVENVEGNYYSFEGLALDTLRPILDDSWLHQQP